MGGSGMDMAALAEGRLCGPPPDAVPTARERGPAGDIEAGRARPTLARMERDTPSPVLATLADGTPEEKRAERLHLFDFQCDRCRLLSNISFSMR